MRITPEQAWREYEVSRLAREKAWADTNSDYHGNVYQRAQARHDRAILVCNWLSRDPYMQMPRPVPIPFVPEPMKTYHCNRIFLNIPLGAVASK